MFESLTASLSSAINSLRGRGKLTEANMREGLAAVQTALLEADVAYDVADGFLTRVADGAVGAGLGFMLLATDGDDDGLPRIGLAPDFVRDSLLEHHVVAEHVVERYVGRGGGRGNDRGHEEAEEPWQRPGKRTGHRWTP